MKVWTCIRFTGHYPVGVSAVLFADSAEEAVSILNTHLQQLGLPGDAEASDMQEFQSAPGAVKVLNDGNY